MSVPSKRTGETIVTKIQWKKSGAIVTFSDGKVELSENAFTEFRLYEGKVITPSEKKKLLAYAKLDGDYNYALRLLSHKGYSEMELRQKLINHETGLENRNKIVSLLKKQGFLDDQEYAANYAEEALEVKCYGRKRILYELKEKGIDETVLAKVKIPKAKEEEAAKRSFEMLLRRYPSLPKRKKQEKITQALYERGFEEGLVHQLVAKVPEGDPKLQKNRLEKEFAQAKLRYARKFEGYELREHIVASLLKKGYPYEEIKTLLEEDFYEND